jgi:sugar-phosphatase
LRLSRGSAKLGAMASFACSAILFDLDGVLVDSTPCVTRIWTAWARERGLDPEYVVHVAHGQRTIETVRAVAPYLDAQAETDEIEQREIDDTEGLQVLPGAQGLLAKLPPDRYTVVTSGTKRLASRRLQVAGLPVPEKMISADDVAKGKPDPEPYLAGARLLAYTPQKCLVFEDAPSGIRSTKAAGMIVVGLTSTYPAKDLAEADYICASLADVSVEMASSGELVVHIKNA